MPARSLPEDAERTLGEDAGADRPKPAAGSNPGRLYSGRDSWTNYEAGTGSVGADDGCSCSRRSSH